MQSLLMQIAAIAAGIAGIGVITAAIYKIYKIANRLESVIGVDEKGRTISERMDKVEYQVNENGGSSMADKINKALSTAEKALIVGETTAVEVKFIKDVMLQLIAMPAEPAEPAPVSRAARRGR